ncbi:MAG: SDR family oxidoreductase [Chloroflexota bacterium]|nr:SDR family oxidoreductase [Chloroflexota bacterium]
MRILITGASGLLGINLALLCMPSAEASRRHIVYGVVNSHPLNTDAFTVLQADLLKPGAVERVLDEAQPEWVIHCAALANLEACEQNPDLAWELNTALPEKLASLCRKGGARLLHVSTDAVFDGSSGDYSEDDTPNPVNLYARTKLEAESVVLASYHEAIVARINLFGWSLTGKRSLAEFFFNNLQAGNRVMGFTDVYFCPLLVNDLAQIFLKMLGKGLRGLYHVVSPECLSKYAFGVAIAQKFGFDPALISPTSVREAGLGATRSPQLTLRIDKLIHDLEQSPPDISTSLERFYTLYQQGYPQKLRAMVDW